MTGAAAPLLSIEGLRVEAVSGRGAVALTEDVSLHIDQREIVGLVGESGCGKSVTAMSILRLLPAPPLRTHGCVLFRGEDILRMPRRRLRGLRGGRIGMIFQEPMTSLNPSFSIGWQLAEALRLHGGLSGAALREKMVEALTRVGIGGSERRLAQYPHELSGGQRQRVMIAMALAGAPELLIADEPTTALDVTIQLQILQLLARLRAEIGMAVLLISHDLGVISNFADRVAVMYAGRIVEAGTAREIFSAPRHPYTAALLLARPKLDGPRVAALPAITGAVPPPGARPPGCAFAPRCPRRLEKCLEQPRFENGVACWNPLS